MELNDEVVDEVEEGLKDQKEALEVGLDVIEAEIVEEVDDETVVVEVEEEVGVEETVAEEL